MLFIGASIVFLGWRSYFLLLFVRCCKNGCRFLTFVATEFTDGSVSSYWLLIVFVVAAGFTNGSVMSLDIVFMCMSHDLSRYTTSQCLVYFSFTKQ